MRKYFIFFFLLVSLTLEAQISGVVTDIDKNPLPSSTVVLLQEVDSIIASYAITNPAGQYTLKKIQPGSYILQVSFIGYQPHQQKIAIQHKNEKIDLQEIRLTANDNVLNEIIVNAERIPIQIKKDTIQYNADAFKTQPNDVVEDLLKKLPGLEVENDGTIKAQGEEVEQVLVDGKRFFGDDPQVATKNLPAKSVDKVEVFDKKSNAAEFTGIDDGQEQKTINIELKEEYKKGVFGTMQGGLGDQERYASKVNLNKFNKEQQISLIGMINNVNQQGFSVDDYINFMGGLGNMMSGGQVRIQAGSGANALPISNGLSDGFVTTSAVGLNFNRDLSSKTQIRSNYLFSQIKNQIDQVSSRQNYLLERTFLSQGASNQVNENSNHRFNAEIEHEFDSTQNVSLKGTFAVNNSQAQVENYNSVISHNLNRENESSSTNQFDGDNVSFDLELLYRKRFQKPGRTITTSVSLGKQNDNQIGDIISDNLFYNEVGNLVSSTLFNQYRDQNNDQIDYGVEIRYTEPLTKNSYLGLNYSKQNFSTDFIQDVFDITGEELVPNEQLSDFYNREYQFDRGEITWRWITGNSNFQFAAGIKNADLQGTSTRSELSIQRNFVNFLPSIDWRYDISNTKNLNFRYQTSTREPSVNQLQPQIDNSNPLNIYIGNPDLNLEYAHNLRIRYSSFSQFSMTNLFATLSASYTRDPIVNSISIDENFIQTTSPINVDNEYRYGLFIGFGTPIRWLGTRINIHGNHNFSRGLNSVNTILERVNRNVSSIDVRFNNMKREVVDLSVGYSISGSNSIYQNTSSLNQNFLRQNLYSDITFDIKKSWSFTNSFDYTFYRQKATGLEQAIPIWTASISKYILGRKGTIKLSGYDLLNQRVGIQQNTTLNYIENIQINSLARYFLMSFEYAINQTGQNKPLGEVRWHGRR